MRQPLFIIALLATPVLWLFGHALVSDEMFVFRDAAHYYYPYYHYVNEQWAAGHVPLWNPLENLGQPLLADPTAAVLYPGKLIFISPLGYDTNYKLYIVGHVLLAAINAFLAARGFARSPIAATLCALSYAFSGAVVFQYCNVVFLVGAAWLPLAILATDRMLVQRDGRWAVALAVVLALMILGGDPQMAYHVGIVAGMYALILWRIRRRRRDQGERNDQVPIGFRAKLFSNRLVLLAFAGGCAFTLAAVQILPSMQWTRHTTRAATDVPRNVYELATGAGDRALPTSQRVGFLLGQTDRGHHGDTYLFSVGPWHLVGYVWPNVFGNMFPENTRWIRALPAEDRMWTPTSYMGLLPLLLALSQLRFFGRARCFFGRARLLPSQNGDAARQEARPPEEPRSRDSVLSRRTWLSWIVVLSLLASFGWYGLGWLASEIYHVIYGAEAESLSVGWSFGGVYWLMQTLLPGYVYFRYPAKWLVVTAMGVSLLAAYGWDGMLQQTGDQTRRFVRRALLIVLGFNMVAGVTAKTLIFDYSTWEQMSRLVREDSLFGPLEVEVAGWTLIGALVSTIMLTAVLLWLIPKPRRETQPPSAPLAPWRTVALLMLLAIDLCLAQRALIVTAPAVSWRKQSTVTAILPRHQFGNSVRRPNIRIYRQVRSPLPFLSSDRQRIGLLWDQATLAPKYQLLHDIEMLESSQSMASGDFSAFMVSVRRHGASYDDGGIPNVSLLESVSTEYILAQGDRWPKDIPRLYNGHWAADELELGALAPRSRVRVVYEVVALPEIESRSSAALRQRTEEVLETLRRDDEPPVIVETDRQLRPPPGSDPPKPPPGPPCEILAYTPQRVELWARLKQDGLVILADAYESNWVCEVTNLDTGEMREEPILRTNRVLRGVWLPKGQYNCRFVYRPAAFRWGALVSGCGWLGVILLAAWSWMRNRRHASLPVG